MTETESLTNGEPVPANVPAASVPATSLLDRQPVRIVGAAQAIATAATSIVALDAPWWAGLALGGGLYAAEEYKRLKVTPTARPRLDADTPLTP